MIEAQGIRKVYGEVVAVDEVSFTARDGRVTGLLGPNGAGKTTSMRLLCGLVNADRGSVRVDGVDALAQPLEARARLGVLPDARGLYPRLTAREHIEYFGRLQGMGKKELRDRAEQLIDRLGMRAYADRKTEGFSQGERMKVALARALVHGPKNLILDEPTNGLDVMSTRAMRELIAQLKDEGHCLVFSSHIMQEVSALCDHIVIVGKGRVVAQGDADALRAKAGTKNLEDAFVQLSGAAGVEGGLS